MILDKCWIHRSQATIKALKKTKIKFWYLPQYNPSQAPVEMVLVQLKKFMINKEDQSLIKWYSVSGQALFTVGLSSIASSTIIGRWEHIFLMMNSYMISLKKKLKEGSIYLKIVLNKTIHYKR